MQSQASWGQGARGAAGYKESGRSGLDTLGAKMKAGSSAARAKAPAQTTRPGRTGDIPIEQWQDALDDFSQEHENWRVSLSITGASERSSTEIKDLPLVGVSMDSNDPSDRCVVVILGDEADDHISHTIAAAKSIRLDEDRRTLEIESESGGTTTLRWSSPPRM